MIEIDLRDYADEVKNTFCNETNCLCSNLYNRSFSKIFKDYVNDLKKDNLFFDRQKSFEQILADLDQFCNLLK